MGAPPYAVLSRSARASASSAVAVGNFDGVHRGHAALLGALVRRAEVLGLPARAVTFDPHPGVVLGRGAPPRLTTLERRAELVRALGAELVVCPFDAELSSWPPRRFAEELLARALGARAVVVGEDFRFGAGRAGDFALLASLGAELGFAAEAAPIAGDAGGPFSSSRVREALAAGDAGEAARVLGRPHSFEGTVARGDARGRALGFPTANLEDVVEVVPARGVYAVRVVGLGHGVMNVGVRPTVSGERETREVHVLDFDGDLYGRRLRVEVVARLREERRFGSVDELRAQIARDVEAARRAGG